MADILSIQPEGADTAVGALTEMLGLAKMDGFVGIAIVAVDKSGSVHVRVPAGEGGLFQMIGALEQIKYDMLVANGAPEKDIDHS